MKLLLLATFAGGCFWCMQPPFDELPGIQRTTVGYMGGHTLNPTYESVSEGGTGHAEAIQVAYDPKLVSYEKLLNAFWTNIDPTAKNRQFADAGTQYRTVIFYHSEDQKKAALASKTALQKSQKFNKDIVVEIVPAEKFYPAEEVHQCYYQKNPVRYKLYKKGSGREDYIKKTWSQ